MTFVGDVGRHGEQPTMNELFHPMLKVPFERANRSFRLLHRHVTREVAALQRSIVALRAEQPPAQHVTVEETITQLAELADRIRWVQAEAKTYIQEQTAAINKCVARVEFVQKHQREETSQPRDTNSSAQPGDGERSVQKEMKDRLIADYLLCHGHTTTSKLLEATTGVDALVDHDVHLECRSILNDLHARNVSSAIAWCADNGSRLRRLQSPLEFQLRLQEFLELVRSDKKLDAIQYAQANLSPLSMQHDEPDMKKVMMENIQEAMATLAYKQPDQCGVESYSRLFAAERWQTLKELFRTTFCQVYGIHNPPSLCIALHAGLSSLNTRACHRVREKRKSGVSEDETSDASDVKRETADLKRQGESVASQRSKKSKILVRLDQLSSLDSTPKRSSSSKRNKEKSAEGVCIDDATIPLCPTCSDVGGRLAATLPFAHHPHSRLVCRITRRIMDEHNPPFVLPNGYVYSQAAIERISKDEDASSRLITCPETQDLYSVTDVKPVYIL